MSMEVEVGEKVEVAVAVEMRARDMGGMDRHASVEENLTYHVKDGEMGCVCMSVCVLSVLSLHEPLLACLLMCVVWCSEWLTLRTCMLMVCEESAAAVDVLV